MMIKKPTLLLSALLSLSCLHAQAATVSVAVAANVQFVFDDLKAAFKQESGHDLQASVNSSGKLTTQIMNGAPFHVFLSADTEFPEKLVKEGFAANTPRVYVYGALVLWSTKLNKVSDWQAALQQASVSKIAVANPKTAPYGRETMRVLAAAGLDKKLENRLVFAESIAQTNQYIHSGVADIGFTAKSVVSAPEMKGQGKWVEIPHHLYQPIAQSAVILKAGKEQQAQAAQQFFDFLYSAKGRAIFEKSGYLLPDNK